MAGINFYSVEKEIALGKQLAIEVQRQTKMLEDPIINEYINRLTQNLVRNSDVKFPVTVKVIEDDADQCFYPAWRVPFREHRADPFKRV